MIEPKTFYKKLDNVLSKIFKARVSTRDLFTIVEELENTFADDIGIANGRIYESQNNRYLLIYPEKIEQIAYPETLSSASDAVTHVHRYGTYIYDDPGLSIDPDVGKGAEYAIPAAFIIESKDRRWIFVFDLKSGWIREEVEFCFNSVRVALNNHLYSESIKDDLKQAANIQHSLLPDQPPPTPGFEIAFRSRAAEFIVGDLYDFHSFDDESFGVCIGDACGHGFPAALLVRDVVTGLRMGLEKEMKIVYSVKKLNRVIHRSNYSTRFVTLFYGELQRDGDIAYINAAHPPPFLVSNGDVKELAATGIALGFMPEIKLHQSYARMNPGDILVLYSDGVIERQNTAGDFFGLERLQELVRQHRTRNTQEIVDLVFDTIYKFGDQTNWRDDTTVLVIKRDRETKQIKQP